MLESEPESPVEKNLPQPKIGSKPSDLGSYLVRRDRGGQAGVMTLDQERPGALLGEGIVRLDAFAEFGQAIVRVGSRRLNKRKGSGQSLPRQGVLERDLVDRHHWHERRLTQRTRTRKAAPPAVSLHAGRRTL